MNKIIDKIPYLNVIDREEQQMSATNVISLPMFRNRNDKIIQIILPLQKRLLEFNSRHIHYF
ncbi:hypothetical protein [Flavobacterium sp.]|uniref:hypothetical protein n=1 Tax=Flavobacterium sp. TaxID=239 RepID=UPI0037C00A31